MLRAAGVRFDRIAINPPFGLDWQDPAHKERGQMNSTVMAFLWALDLMDHYGTGAMICGRDRLYREVLRLPEAKGIYSIIEVEGKIWDTSGKGLPTAIAFFSLPANRMLDRNNEPSGEVFKASIHIENLPSMELADQVRVARQSLMRDTYSYVSAYRVKESWDMVNGEWQRRQKDAASKKKSGPK